MFVKKILCGIVLSLFSIQTVLPLDKWAIAAPALVGGKLFLIYQVTKKAARKKTKENLQLYKMGQDIADGAKGNKVSTFSDAEYKQELKEIEKGGLLRCKESMDKYPGEALYKNNLRALPKGSLMKGSCNICEKDSVITFNKPICTCEQNLCLGCVSDVVLSDEKCPSCKKHMTWNTIAKTVFKN